jgi:hypothetical protein
VGAQRFDRQEELRVGGNPVSSVRAQASAGNQVVNRNGAGYGRGPV